MSLADDIKKIDVDVALDITVRALDVIGTLAGSANAHGAADIIMVIRHIVAAVTKVAEGTTTSEEAHAELDKLLAGIADNDAAADAALDDKFGSSGD